MPNFCESDKNYGLDYSNPKQEIYKMVHNKKTGEEQLKVVEEVDIEEQLQETQDIVEAYKKDRILVNEYVLKEAGDNIDNDIAFMYKTKINDSKKLKEKFGLASTKLANSKESISVINKLGEKVEINQYEI